MVLENGQRRDETDRSLNRERHNSRAIAQKLVGLKLKYGTYNKEEPYQVSSRRDQGIVSIERCVKEFSENFGRTATADKKLGEQWLRFIKKTLKQ